MTDAKTNALYDNSLMNAEIHHLLKYKYACGYMLEASRMMPSMLGMPRMSAGLAGGMPGAPLMGGLHGKVGGKGWEIVGVGRLIRSKIM
jgi:hypothetical protein